MASALDFAHRKNIIHRDLKPDNVMFREDEAAVLTDFGIAKETNADINLTQTGLIVGTPKYMSPEQIKGSDPSPQGDIYSLGIMFFQLLCNRVPFEGADLMATAYQHFNEPVPQLPPQVSQYQGLIEHMLAKDVEDRIPRGKDVIKELERIERQHPLKEESCETVVMQATKEGIQNDETIVKQGSLQTQVVVPESLKSRTSSQPTMVKTTAPSDETVAVAAAHAPPPSQQQNHEPQTNTTPTGNTSENIRSQGINASTPLIFGAVAVVLVVVGIIFSMSSSSPSEESTSTASLQQVSPPENSDQITQLLLAALEDLSNNRLRQGPSNALSKYEQILILSPGHPQALAGKQNIAKKFLSLAKTDITNKKFSIALSHIENAQDIAPEVDASDIQDMLNAAKRDTSNPISTLKKVQIAGLLENAKIYEKEGKISSPIGENAIENYKKILEIDPYHSEAKTRLAALQ